MIVEARRVGRRWQLTIPDRPNLLVESANLRGAPAAVARLLKAIGDPAAAERCDVRFVPNDVASGEGLAEIHAARAERDRAQALLGATQARVASQMAQVMPQRDVAELMGVSHQRVHQLVEEDRACGEAAAG